MVGADVEGKGAMRCARQQAWRDTLQISAEHVGTAGRYSTPDQGRGPQMWVRPRVHSSSSDVLDQERLDCQGRKTLFNVTRLIHFIILLCSRKAPR